MIVKCSSPTCRVIIDVLSHGPVTLNEAMHALHPVGWRWRQMPGDNRPMPYCERCAQ